MNYDITLLTSSGDLIGILQAFNVYAEGWFGVLILFMFCAMFFMIVSLLYGSKNALISSSIIGLLLSYPLLAISLLTITQFWVIIILCVVLVLALFSTQ